MDDGANRRPTCLGGARERRACQRADLTSAPNSTPISLKNFIWLSPLKNGGADERLLDGVANVGGGHAHDQRARAKSPG